MMMYFIIPYAIIFLASDFASSRTWHDTGSGTIVLEEAWIPQELLFQISNTTTGLNSTNAELKSNLLDIHNQRLDLMNQNNIDFMVLSCAQPCIQGISDPNEAASMAVLANNLLFTSISNNTARFGAFASLAMHNASIAAQELNRTVTELGFLGALVNDYQQSGTDNSTVLFYDQPEYDVFWQMVSDLNVPVYFHPRNNIAQVSTLLYHHAHFLSGAPQEYAATLSTHILGLCTNGVFDRFPNVKIIVGHLGERIPSDLFRIDEQLVKQKANGMPMQKNVTSYWRTNIYETTSGNFATSLLQFHAQQIGLNRILFSIDYPFVSIPEGSAWVDTLGGILNEEQLTSLKRGLAIELLRLNE